MTRREDREKRWRLLVAAVALSALAACGGGGDYGGGGGAATYTLGGMVVGVNGPGLVLRNGDERLSVAATGAFTFATRLAAGTSYAVSVSGHPANQTCSATNASGTMGTANVTNIAVACVAAEPPPPPPPNTYTIGGEVTGLSGSGLVLTNTFGSGSGSGSGSADLGVSGNGAFTFGARVADGMPYAVSVSTQPSGQTCTVDNASGTIGAANVSNIRVNCGAGAPVVHSIGGRVINLTTAGLVLHNNGGDALTVPSGATSFVFAARVPAAGGYRVTVATQPGTNLQDSQDCTVARGEGSASADVTDVEVTCGPMGNLRLLGSDPPEAATGVSRSVQPALNFSSPLNIQGGFSGFMRVVGGGAIPVQQLATSGSQLRFAPQQKLLPLTQYRVVIDKDPLRGVRGESLSSQLDVQFTTADSEWRAMQAVDPNQVYDTRGSDGTLESSVAVDQEGNALAAWRGINDGDASGIMVSRYSAASQTWSTPRKLLGQPGLAGRVALAMDQFGNAVAVWRQLNPSNYMVLWSARFDKASGTWDAPVLVSHVDGSSAGKPALVVHGESGPGRATVAWVREEAFANGFGTSVWMAESTLAPGAPWQAPRRIDAEAGAPPSPNSSFNGFIRVSVAMASSPAGHRAIVWMQRVNDMVDIPVIWARRIDNTNVLDRPNGADRAAIISNNNGDPELWPQVAVGPTGQAVVAWQQSEPASQPARDFSNLWMVSSTSIVGPWGNRTHVAGSGDASNKAGRPVLGVCGGGGACIANAGNLDKSGAWLAWRDTGGQVLARRVDDRGAGPVRVIASAEGQYLDSDAAPDLVVDPLGNAAVFWAAEGSASAQALFRSARFNAKDDVWQPSRTLAENLMSRFEVIAAGINSLTGDVLTAWEGAFATGTDGEGRNWAQRRVQTRRLD